MKLALNFNNAQSHKEPVLQKKFNFNVNDSGGKEMKEGYGNEVLF